MLSYFFYRGIFKADIKHMRAGSHFRFYDLGGMRGDETNNILPRVIQIAENPRPGWACFHTGRFQASLHPMHAPITFLRDMMEGIDVSHPVRACCHTIPAADTTMGIDIHNTAILLVRGLHRTHRDANRVFTIIAEDRQEVLPNTRIRSFLHLFHPRPPDT